jgi:hypothetical protein
MLAGISPPPGGSALFKTGVVGAHQYVGPLTFWTLTIIKELQFEAKV